MILTDRQVRELCAQHELVREGFDDSRLHGCTYEFTIGRIAYRYDYQNKTSRQQVSHTHVIYPFETLTIVTAESIHLDARHYLFLHSKGFLFSLGVVPVCTGADPGFSGPLGITLTNLSARPIALPVGTRFVKGVFCELEQEVEKPYIGGHGDATMDWPYPSQYQADHFDLVEYSKHLERFLPAPFATAILVTGTVGRYLKWIIGFLIVLGVANLSSFFYSLAVPHSWSDKLTTTLNVVGAISSIVALIVTVVTLKMIPKVDRR